eukprot:TRINITY_DN7913_c0_g3_i2.p1 TRINITY_DN7913_c0_g3~~TRINITY_DN7913_c0_g3_i2.p1  ORF type:complete len:116 (-),score=21.93 TRINITY_DN7913_c0_g3_i2:51-398(-)
MESLERVQNWVKELRKVVGDKISLYMIGNKADLQRQYVVSKEKAQSYAQQVGAKHFLTSCKLGQGINEMFLDLAKTLSDDSQEGTRVPLKQQRSQGVKIINDSPTNVQSKSGCCS